MPRWSPWAAASKLPDVEIRLADLPEETGGGVLVRRGRRAWILLERTLSQAERRCVLAHELVHLERGTNVRCRWHAPSWTPMVAREELAVDRIVAERLVPVGELRALAAKRLSIGEPLEMFDVEEHFEVDAPTARLALLLLNERERRSA